MSPRSVAKLRPITRVIGNICRALPPASGQAIPPPADIEERTRTLIV